MHVRHRVARVARTIAVAAAILAVLVSPAIAPRPVIAAGLPAWHGGIDLYRTGAFTTQKTWQWCTAADVQIIRNIADRGADHSRSNQQRYFSAMRAHNRYAIPVSDGVDPAGWTYGLRHFVDSRYRLVASSSFNSALRSAVTGLRKTNLPVGITVGHGNHAWVLTGFTATADPAKTTRFTITSVRVTGPLWGLQSRSYGYDMRPDTKLTPKQLAGFFTPWHYAKIRMAWEGRWVSIQPTGKAAAAAAAAPALRSPTPRPSPAAIASTPPSPSVAPTAGLSAPPSPALGIASANPRAAGPVAPAAQDGSPPAGAAAADGSLLPWMAAGALLLVALVLAVRLAGPIRRRPRPGSATR
jgi:hypothetical protein